MVTLYTGKKRLEETPKVQKKKIPKVELPPVVQPALTPADSVWSPTPLGKGQPQIPSLYPGQTITTGTLKPEAQAFEDVAAFEQGVAGLPPEEQLVTSELIKPSDTKRFFPELSLKVEGLRKFESSMDFLREFKAAIKGVGAAVGLRKIGTFLGGDRLDKLKTSSDLVIQGVKLGSIDPATAQSMFDSIDIEIGKENSRVQLEAKYDIPSIIDGTSSEAQVEMLNLIRYNANKKAELAEALRAKMISDIQAQTRTYRPGLGGR